MLRGVRPIALLTLLAFGCTTVRVSALPGAEVVDAPGTIAQPVVELWLESSEEVSQAQSGRAADAARQAISQALSELRISPSAMGADDAVLFVRERGVALTDARERQQTWARIGIVAVVAAVIIGVVVASRAGGGGGRHFTKAAMPKGGGAVVRPIAPRMAQRAVPLAPRFLPRYSGAPFFVGFSFYVPIQPMVIRSDPDDDAGPFPPDTPVPMIEATPLPPGDGTPQATDSEPPPPEDEPPLELPPLAPPADFNVENRGFFDGTHIGLQLDLLDRATGEVLWSKPVASDGNPCDPGDVGKLLESALAGQPWARAANR
jgi:ElaB/YqjD/DUF883 family membrane-anchored ribosome-binding protein